jgi:hypothetical protein
MRMHLCSEEVNPWVNLDHPISSVWLCRAAFRSGSAGYSPPQQPPSFKLSTCGHRLVTGTGHRCRSPGTLPTLLCFMITCSKWSITHLLEDAEDVFVYNLRAGPRGLKHMCISENHWRHKSHRWMGDTDTQAPAWSRPLESPHHALTVHHRRVRAPFGTSRARCCHRAADVRRCGTHIARDLVAGPWRGHR